MIHIFLTDQYNPQITNGHWRLVHLKDQNQPEAGSDLPTLPSKQCNQNCILGLASMRFGAQIYPRYRLPPTKIPLDSQVSGQPDT